MVDLSFLDDRDEHLVQCEPPVPQANLRKLPVRVLLLREHLLCLLLHRAQRSPMGAGCLLRKCPFLFVTYLIPFS